MPTRDQETVTPDALDVKTILSCPKNRPEHKPSGDVCKCGVLATHHRHRKRTREYLPREVGHIIGFDGEGWGRDPHLYTYVAASDEDGEVWELEDTEGLSTVQCLEMILALPGGATIVSYSNTYDLTKILEALPNKLLYKLFHPETRRRILDSGRAVYRRVKWLGYWFNWMNGKFTVGRIVDEQFVGTRVIWDIWRFFQSKFTKALVDWNIATERELEEMNAMKALRGVFEHASFERIKRYCKDECRKLARLFRSLLDAHRDADVRLTNYYGAGSTSSALLKKMHVKDYIKPPPKEMKHAVACGFFAGRFEDSIVGPVYSDIDDSDLSSAYPYHATFLPCLIHGRWTFCSSPNDRDIDGARLALVHWELPYTEPVGPWAPWPVRGKDKTLVFPWSCPGGWVWGREFLVGKKLRPDAKAKEAWLYHTECSCQPFKDFPVYYRERIRVGKSTGPGKVFKLGPNGGYGKLAQTSGHNPPFQSFILAGNITSETRADILIGILAAPNPWDILSVATDGIKSGVTLELPKPRETGTSHLEFPLGGWEQKTEGGRFFVRPGVSFPLYSLDRGAKVKSRGYNKRTIENYTMPILDAWERGDPGIAVDDGEHFGSVKAEISKTESGYNRSRRFGDWFKSIKDMSFDPKPKRERIPGSNRLAVIKHWEEESYPYAKAL